MFHPFLQNSQYQTNVNIQLYKSHDNAEKSKSQKALHVSNAKKNENKEMPGWQQEVVRQNHMYDHPVLRRINTLNVFYLTAVASNTSTSAYWDRVVINGWETVKNSEDQPKYYCCFDTNGHIDVAEVSKIHTWGLRIQGVIAAVQFICNRSPSGIGETPNRVALTVSTVCKQNELKFMNIDYSYMYPDNTIGVCAKIAYGHFPAERILEWVEINKEMGADHVVLFTYNLTDDAMEVVKHYSQSGYMTHKEFDFPMKSKNLSCFILCKFLYSVKLHGMNTFRT